MHDQYSRGSSLIGWVYQDASYIVDRIRAAPTTERHEPHLV
jgi:hypothetical protein